MTCIHLILIAIIMVIIVITIGENILFQVIRHYHHLSQPSGIFYQEN